MNGIFKVMLSVAMLVSASMASAQGNYQIQPGDVLDITVLEDPNLNREVLVRPDGGISIPIAGNIRAGGNTISAVERVITERLASGFSVTPNVSVALKQLAVEEEFEPATINIFMVGEVSSPGLKEVEVGTTLLQAIAQGGGLGRFAASKRVQLRRTDRKTGQETIYLFNYHAVENGGSIKNNLVVRSGDVIVVPERKLFE